MVPLLKKVINERNMKELLDLLIRQQAEKTKDVRNHAENMANLKASHKDQVDSVFDNIKQTLEKGGMAQDKLDAEIEKLMRRRQARLD